ncbi:MAG TPA: hypothetical protein VJG32_05590 [Anaerolineae bacterium]|nr:hypothetical protein [Anaerolineae bacterium]
MSGFALMFDREPGLAADTPAFVDFLDSVSSYKQLDKPDRVAEGSHCLAAKLDSASTLHHGITFDRATGAWLLAAGTVIDPLAFHPNGDLHQLLTDYLDHGARVFDRLDGHFALAIYDRREQTVVVVADPFGFISMFYAQSGSRFFVSTSALAIAKAAGSQPDELGIREFLLYIGVFGERTLWQSVKRMLPATVLKLTRSGVQQSTYWSFNLEPAIRRLPLREAVDCAIDRLACLLKRDLAREGKAWLSLTGGLDTRMLAALAHHSALPFKSYCHGQPDSRDVRLASQISQVMGWEHEYFPLPEDWGCERAQWLERTLGQTDAHLDVLKLSRIIREQTLKARQYDASWWGFGGETYRGYHWKQEFLNLRATPRIDYDRFIGYRVTPTSSLVLKDTAHWIGVIHAELKAQLSAVGEQQPGWPKTVKLDLMGEWLEHAWAGAHISAALGLQRAVSPLDFKEGVTCVISIHPRWRVFDRLFRLILERIAPALANAETADGGPALPMRLTNLHRFVPYWLSVAEKLAWGASYRLTRKSLWNKRDSGPAGKAYPVARWRRETLRQLEAQSLLAPAKMHSAGLYDSNALQAFLARAQADDFREEPTLGRMITVEMALRSVGVSL